MSCNCEQNVSVGRLQRGNPLPTGTYWIDVIDDTHQTMFGEWLAENSQSVNVLKSEHFAAINWPDCDVSLLDCWPSRDWVKFEVKESVPWPAPVFGYPNIIEPGEKIESSQDTSDVPDVPSSDCDIACQTERVALAAGGLLVLGIIFMAVKH